MPAGGYFLLDAAKTFAAQAEFSGWRLFFAWPRKPAWHKQKLCVSRQFLLNAAKTFAAQAELSGWRLNFVLLRRNAWINTNFFLLRRISPDGTLKNRASSQLRGLNLMPKRLFRRMKKISAVSGTPNPSNWIGCASWRLFHDQVHTIPQNHDLGDAHHWQP